MVTKECYVESPLMYIFTLHLKAVNHTKHGFKISLVRPLDEF